MLITPSLRCGHFSSRIELGKLIEDMIEDIHHLLCMGIFSDDSIAEILPKRGYILPASSFMEHKTSVEALNRIMELLLDDRTRRIGVLGMGGVGKTTIMVQINNRLLSKGLFDSVVWISVSKESSLDKLQKDIATNPFSLETVGIPTPTTENGCKLVMTTRSVETCGRMETDQVVQVEVLSEDEAWSLFKSKAGNLALTSPDIQSIAKGVTKECGGLPLAIVTVGGALRYAQDISEWESALAELKDSNAAIGGIDEAVISRLRLSFNRLNDDTYRSCFLFCALYPEDHLIDLNELIEYWIFEGLLGVEGTTTKQKKQKAQSILNVLRRACLLESVTQDRINYVKLHDFIRDMAITIMTRDPVWHSIVKPFAGLANWEHIKWAEDVKRVSLMRNDLKGIHIDNIPPCTMLTSLLLQYNSFSGNLPDNMFDFLPALNLLDLSYTGISCLPKSLSNLKNLRALLLSNCWNLTAVPSLGKLITLMVLDLSCCRHIQELPHGTEELRILRRLNISSTSIAILPSGLLSSLRFLEELLTSNCNVVWATDILKEFISSSSSLYSLEVDFCDLEDYYHYVESCYFLLGLEKFKFRIGQAEAEDIFTQDKSIGFRGQIFRLLPQSTQELMLHMVEILRVDPSNFSSLKIIDVANCPKLKNLFSGEDFRYLICIEEISVRHCEGMKELMKCRINDVVEIPVLKRLRLIDLPKLESICNGTIISGYCLESIEIIHCDVLKRLPLCRTEWSPTLEIKATVTLWRSLAWDDEDLGRLMEQHFVPLPVISDDHGGSSSQAAAPMYSWDWKDPSEFQEIMESL
ncbi:hypothetical protein L6164_026354 [Bauhinia variegata]|uniref:Uncharacterized protein n=1 Tax=Bauhinia variegata TaxID=167791 RepID=A0ACB9LPG2_BAUVA|nr:hypothetical protein L6164_026354 [Bauhinia variegata]